MHARLIAPVLGLAMMVGCSSPGYKKAETTNSSLGDVKSELITDKTTLTAAVNDLNDLIYNPKNNLKPQYEKFAAEVTALQKAQVSSRKSARNLVADREAYLSKWKADTATQTDPDIRMRSIERIKQVENDFFALGDTLIAADNALAPLVNDLDSLKKYLGNDLTAAGIKNVSDLATNAKNKSITVNGQIDKAIVEVDKVSNAIAPMPTTAPSDPAPATP